MSTPPEVDHARLGPLEQIGSGGQGKVFALVDDPNGAVYKEYSPRVIDDLDVDALRRFAGFAGELDEADRVALLGRTAWPEVIVRRDGVVRGFLMRRVPGEYTADLRFGGTTSSELAAVQYLLNPPAYLRDRGLRVDDRFRLEFLRDTAEALVLFHRLGISVGDLSPNNLLFSLTGRPRCFFIDCDTMSLDGESVLPQAETPDWRVGALGDEELGTPASDAYKFGLLVVRLFAADQQTTDPRAVPASLRRLVVANLSGEPDLRRTPSAWLKPLDQQLRRAPQSPPPLRPVRRRAGSTPPPRPPIVLPRPRTPAWVYVGMSVVGIGLIFGLATIDTDSPTPTIPVGDTWTPPVPSYVPTYQMPPYTPPVIDLPDFTLPAPPLDPFPRATLIEPLPPAPRPAPGGFTPLPPPPTLPPLPDPQIFPPFPNPDPATFLTLQPLPPLNP